MLRGASELAHRLAREAEAVCRHYLSNGRRKGHYWQVGDARNTPGRSMFVRLTDWRKALRANGPTPRRVSTAISSISSARAAALSISTTSSKRPAASSAFRASNR